MDSIVKQEIFETGVPVSAIDGFGCIDPSLGKRPAPLHHDYDDDDRKGGFLTKKQRLNDSELIFSDSLPFLMPEPVSQVMPMVELPVDGHLGPFPPCETLPLLIPAEPISQIMPGELWLPTGVQSCRQFWKAGEYGEDQIEESKPLTSSGMDHVRIHPKFLHSNATSHKWALGAFAELLDNSLDELCHGATYVNVDVLEDNKDGSRMLLIEDDGGGMDPIQLRQCMSLGYSVKSKMANTIGQYGNGFKTSTMRLGADVIVFTRCRGKEGRSWTQSIGMLSYTFLKRTGKEDIVVPMLHYEKKQGTDWNKLMPSSSQIDWNRNLDTIVQWSPYYCEAHLLEQFNSMKDQGTRIIIYNLWEDDQGELELDFGADRHDIQIRGVNRDEAKIKMAEKYPNSTHFLTYRHSLRSYASILYLKLPPGFRMILRGKDIEHHNIVDDMMLKQEITYRPLSVANGSTKDPNMVAVVTIGFAMDAKYHIDIQGFNVYHKNRLIKPFWRVWNSAGSGGRGVVGVLEANFVEPAHDKQGFERTIVLARLETKLVQMQKAYWSNNSHEIGYFSQQHTKKRPEYSSIKSCSSSKGTSSNGHKEHDLMESREKLLEEENRELRDRLKKSEESMLVHLQLERDKSKLLEAKLQEAVSRLEEADREREALIDLFSEERIRRDREEESLAKKLMESNRSIVELIKRKTMKLEPLELVETSAPRKSQH